MALTYFFVDTFVIGSAIEQLDKFLKRNPGYKPYYRNLSSFGPKWIPFNIDKGDIMKIEKIEFAICYTTVTPESAEYGDFDDSGFEIESYIPDDFADIISLVERYGFKYWSSSDGTGWLSSGYDIDDYQTLTEVEYTLHPKNSRSERYMQLALNAARV